MPKMNGLEAVGNLKIKMLSTNLSYFHPSTRFANEYYSLNRVVAALMAILLKEYWEIQILRQIPTWGAR